MTALKWGMRFGAGLAFLAVGYFLAVVTVLHFICPTFNPTHRFLSEYARSEYGAWMTSNFFVMAAGAFALAGGLYCEARAARRWWPGPLLIALCGVFLLVLGAFTTDLQEGPKTTFGHVHDLASTLPLSCVIAAMVLFLIRFKRDPHWRRWHRPTLLLGLATGCLVAMAYLAQFSLRWSGLIQRSIALPLIGWLLLLAAALWMGARDPQHRRGTSQGETEAST
jgi:Protein of unknown function (DUF998)